MLEQPRGERQRCWGTVSGEEGQKSAVLLGSKRGGRPHLYLLALWGDEWKVEISERGFMVGGRRRSNVWKKSNHFLHFTIKTFKVNPIRDRMVRIGVGGGEFDYGGGKKIAAQASSLVSRKNRSNTESTRP